MSHRSIAIWNKVAVPARGEWPSVAQIEEASSLVDVGPYLAAAGGSMPALDAATYFRSLFLPEFDDRQSTRLSWRSSHALKSCNARGKGE